MKRFWIGQRRGEGQRTLFARVMSKVVQQRRSEDIIVIRTREREREIDTAVVVSRGQKGAKQKEAGGWKKGR